MKHKHHELIIAWALGSKIDCLIRPGVWKYCPHPSWGKMSTYRLHECNKKE